MRYVKINLLHPVEDSELRKRKRQRAKRLRREGRKRRAAEKMEYLIECLGGRCAQCGALDDLEVDHADGITWIAAVYDWETRLNRYARELMEGVRLRLLCRRCNGKDGRKRQMQGKHNKGRRCT